MKLNKTYDIIVIGAGSGGLTAAVGFTKVGKRVLLVEKEHMGGECTNSGCIPSKALLHRAKTYYNAKLLSGGSEDLDNYRKGALEYVKGKISEVLSDEKPEAFEKMGMDVVIGNAVFENSNTISVDGKMYGFKKAIIATGSSPRMIQIPGLDEEDILTNQNVFSLSEIPKNLLVVGSGPIGMELGQAFAMLGSNVTIVSRDSRFARLEDEKISKVLQKKFGELGITTLLNAELKRASEGVGVVAVKEEKDIEVSYDKVLIAIGRVPNIPEGLDKAGIVYDKHSVVVNKQYRTSNKNVYALGDVAQRFKFTHTADDTARQVVAHIASKHIIRVNNKKAIPKVTYTYPEVASVGMGYKQVCQKYDCSEYMRIEIPYSSNDRAKTDSDTEGILVLTARRLTGTILGANIIGPSAGEIIALFTVAIDRKISMYKLGSTIFAYPTYSLIVKKAGDMFLAETINSFKKDFIHFLYKYSKIFLIAVLLVVSFVWLYKYVVV
jgi:pyruvate/2-oxoglutarate dehydrogenase complex dihydrolipoamide dehydrogenase (E3) component